MARLLPTILALRHDPRLLRAPPYFSTLLVIIGLIWLLLLPLDSYSRHTYISENALLPGQVHTYFGGSEQQVFNAYKHEVEEVGSREQASKTAKIIEIFDSAGLRAASQKYSYRAANRTFSGENVYAILRAPRGDATEAVVLAAAWTNMDGQLNSHGVPLVLTLARYFARWSLWSKDIIILVTSDSRAGPQAWVDAYHNEHDPASVDPLPIKSGALQGVVVVDKALDRNFEKIHIVYDGINGQLPNLDLFNTACSIASGQMGMGIAFQRMFKHNDSYLERLQTMLRGMVSQGAGHSSGPHSSFIPYHVDAITLQAVGEGREDDMAMGRVVESIFRSLNNLLEHFHQSFFFYLLMQADRFVSIGTYLPSAMLVAANFTIMAIALWVRSGRPNVPKVASATAEKGEKPEMELIQQDGMTAVVPKESLKLAERPLFVPIALVAAAHFSGLIPLYILNHMSREYMEIKSLVFLVCLLTTINFPAFVAGRIRNQLTVQHQLLTQCLSHLLLGMFLATLATLNFSLSLFVGLACIPLPFTGPSLSLDADMDESGEKYRRACSRLALYLLSPPSMLWILSLIAGTSVADILMEGSVGWNINGMWTPLIIWCVWWPAWLVGSVLSSAPPRDPGS